ncbi:integrating conjugative element protein [Escherichia coli]|nr:integrating conjugative element protein [Escherichia coli]EEQ7438491.1 integrating conjugative element protein [Escherichia coli]EEY9026859.1 integrating conjugative element protein [Escherichia coli]
MKRERQFYVLSLLLFCTTAGAELKVIADLGGRDASPFFEAINRQPPVPASVVPSPSFPQGEAAMLPVSTPEMSPGEVVARRLQLPGIGALFLVGDDAHSRTWLQMNAAVLRERKAAGMVVNVADESSLRVLRELAPGVVMVPASGSVLARRLQISHYPVLTACLVLSLLAVVLGPALWRSRRKKACVRTRRHQRYRATASRVMKRLNELQGDARRLKYLRKISPYVFEELLLLAFEQQGMPVIRNPSYSGDGGLDGQVVINGERWLIQAKRYGRTIRPAHIDAFGELLRRKGCRGFFIHTGRTGNISRARLTLWPDIELISGQRLLQLLNGTLLSNKGRS